MKVFYEGEKGQAVCRDCGRVSTTFGYHNVPFSDGNGTAKNILAATCDKCGRVVGLPPQSTPAIKAARERALAPLEAKLPAPYLEVLDLACYRIAPSNAPDFRKRLLMYYVRRYRNDTKAAEFLGNELKSAKALFESQIKSTAQKRLSLKVSESMSRDVQDVMNVAHLSKTDLFKSIVLKIKEDIVEPDKPQELDRLQEIAAILNC